MESLTNFLKIFSISDEHKEFLKNEIKLKIETGLAQDPSTYMYSPVRMLPTYISVFNSHERKGCFVSIDFGGTHLRFVKITVDKSYLFTEYTSDRIPEYIKKATRDELFDYIANYIKKGLRIFHMKNERINHMGFSFSFPCAQNALNHGVLINWTKGFDVKDVVGKDVVELLLKACHKIELNIDDFCLLNDTTGLLLSGSYEDRNTFLGFINGTGTNACYVEKAKNVKRLMNTYEPKESIIINTEWGSLGDNGSFDLILTKYDKILDENSINPGHQIFEKCVAGLYLPELVRIIITQESRNFQIFQNVPERLSRPYSIDGKYLSLIYEKNEFFETFRNEFDYEVSWKEYGFFKEICKYIVTRASVLTALGLSQLIDRINADKIVIAFDGSVCRKHPTYLLMVDQELKKHSKKHFEFMFADDGSGKGSALAASLASLKN